MEVAFLTPPQIDGTRPVERVFGCSYQLYSIPNVFIFTAASLLENHGHRVKCVDLSQERPGGKEIERFIHKDKSNVYCIYSVFLSQNSDLISLDFIRAIKKDVPIVFVGPAPTFDPGEFLRDENVYVLRGEFELTLIDLLRNLRGKNISDIQGISYLSGAGVVHNDSTTPIQELDTLPYPNRYLQGTVRYYSPKFKMKPFTTMLTSRGCPHRCIFCVPNSLTFARELEHKRIFGSKPPVYSRSAENVIGEFRMLKKQGFETVSIIDDQFVLSEERTIKICEGIRNLGINWGCACRPDYLNEKIIKAMVRAGCSYIDMGIESFFQEDLDYIKKDLKVQTIYSAVGLLKKYRVWIKANILLGCTPFHNKERIRHNQAIAKKIGIDQVMYNICTPYPGTEFLNMSKKEKWLIYGEFRPCDVQKKAIISYPSLKKGQLERLARWANISFFLSPRFIFKNIIRFKSFGAIYFYLKILIRKLKR